MRDDYLWDGSGEPDPEVERLETLLGRFQHDRPAPAFPTRARGWRLPPLSAFLPLRAAVAAMVLLAAGVWVATRPATTTWEVTRLDGRPVVGSTGIEKSGRLGVGQSLETDGASRARMNIGMVGEVQVEQNTRVRLLEARPTEHRLALDRGKIRAMIWAPPRLFFVETPSATAIDLGCAYTLEVAADGSSLVRTTMGWVGFEWKGRESFIPAGAACATRPGMGPGTPYYEDVTEGFRSALSKLDFEQLDAATHAAVVETLLAETRSRDGLTLWHLLSRLEGDERARVYDRMAALVPPPSGVTREGVLRGDRRMLDLWWETLGLGDPRWWRLWKSPFPTK